MDRRSGGLSMVPDDPNNLSRQSSRVLQPQGTPASRTHYNLKKTHFEPW